jgi:hypothetical protein
MWITPPEFIHSFADLSTKRVDKWLALWTVFGSLEGNGGRGLWINLWIRGVKSVDKPVENSVENSSLWISRDLSTFYPQEAATYPHFCPQPRGRFFGLGKGDRAGYPHIHSPYYYYYSNKYMV